MKRPDKKDYRENEISPFGASAYEEDLEMYIDFLIDTKFNNNLIQQALEKLDEHLQIVNPIELGIFKIKLGKYIDVEYKNAAIKVVKDVLKSGGF